MDKYKETTDLMAVWAALEDGLETNGCRYGRWTAAALDGDEIIWYPDGTMCTEPGRKFRIEIPRPDPGEGWRLLEHDEVLCEGDEFYRDSERVWDSDFPHLGQVRDIWYRRKVENPAKPVLRRVELYRDDLELLLFNVDGNHAKRFHSTAPSVKGFCVYEYTEISGERRTEAVLYFRKQDFGIEVRTYVTIDHLDFREWRPIYPVAFWVMEDADA